MRELKIPEDLQALHYDCVHFTEDTPMNARLLRELIERIARLEADNERLEAIIRCQMTSPVYMENERLKNENAALKAQVERLKAPVSDKEFRQWWNRQNYVMGFRAATDALIAARASAEKEQG